MADIEEPQDNRFDDVDLDSILARVERRGPLTFTRKRCLYRAPEFVKKLPKEETIEEGSTVKFECKAVGFPKPSLKWTKDLEILPDNPRFTFQFGELAKPKSPKRSQQRVITFTSHFTTITERIDEEEREAEEFMRQPISPLAYLYDSITIKEKPWPEFLGSWAFLTTDFDGINENMDDIGDEDVFLPEYREISDSESNYRSERDSDNCYENDMENAAAIPYLVFENKNLSCGNKDINSNKSANFSDLLAKDENANHRINFQCSQDKALKHNVKDCINNNVKNCKTFSRLKSEHREGQMKECKGTENGVCEKVNINKKADKQYTETDRNIDKKFKTETSSFSKSGSISSSQKRPLMSGVSSSVKRPLTAQKSTTCSVVQDKEYSQFYRIMIFMFVLSGFTFLALSFDTSPTDFVFTVLIGQIVYIIVNYLCGNS